MVLISIEVTKLLCAVMDQYFDCNLCRVFLLNWLSCYFSLDENYKYREDSKYKLFNIIWLRVFYKIWHVHCIVRKQRANLPLVIKRLVALKIELN